MYTELNQEIIPTHLFQKNEHMAGDITVDEASLCVWEHEKPFAFECFEDPGIIGQFWFFPQDLFLDQRNIALESLVPCPQSARIVWNTMTRH